MRIHQLGDGTPEVAVVASIHGDEPCGARAVERLLTEDLEVERPVKLIVVNEEALERGVRYVDEDLNRAFPGDPNGDSHEARLAHALTNELRDCTVLSLHSTQSYSEPFALVKEVDAVARSICPHLPVDLVVETDAFSEGRLIEHPHTVEVECGLQGSDEAAENAYWLVRAFLTATGVLPAPLSDDPVDAGEREGVRVYRLTEPIPKPPAGQYEVFVNNFEPVDAGARFATADGETFTADEPFYPILLSSNGYEDVFGYAGEMVGVLD
ncbi:succinylglutamate desuccinylase/aspartoacylase family protein [Halobium salinum]|uniref:Succinylglutamate desuccinylase/aspartoacylase family protein n=1 Tax=Halobium salinum TaxID=1364940 RepID=A0ABD5P9H0_9EURY|nr:succinylglutamate desuccinylase/aspartoacylase family protein [Halobium salinum]